jgi:hypothetical protein
MMKSKRASLDNVDKTIYFILGVVVLFKLVAVLLPEAQDAGDELNTSGVPFGSLFTGDGIVFIVIMAGLLIVVVKQALNRK